MAKYTPSQVIKLAYICALLEQKHDQGGKSKRFKAIAFFLNQAVKVVPLESIFRAIAYQKYEIALECAEALKKRKLNLHASQLMIMGALKASIRAHLGYEGGLIDRLIIPPVVPIHHMLMLAKSGFIQSTGKAAKPLHSSFLYNLGYSKVLFFNKTCHQHRTHQCLQE